MAGLKPPPCNHSTGRPHLCSQTWPLAAAAPGGRKEQKPPPLPEVSTGSSGRGDAKVSRALPPAPHGRFPVEIWSLGQAAGRTGCCVTLSVPAAPSTLQISLNLLNLKLINKKNKNPQSNSLGAFPRHRELYLC